jgi:hypothetical protein
MTESFRTLFDKKYMKIFAVGILLLILGILFVWIRNLYTTFADPSTPGEMEDYLQARGALYAFSSLFVELGLLLVTLSTFIGGVVDESLSPEVRRGLVFATSIAIISLALIIVFTGSV